MIAMLLVACGTPAQPEIPPPLPPAPVEQATPPATDALGDVLQKLGQQRDEIKALLDAGKLSEVHPVCEEMDKTAVLAAVRAASLPAADQNTVTLTATDMKAVLDALHDAADAGNAAEATAQLAKLDADLAKLAPLHHH